jgi:hypothetical protein
LHAAMSSRWMMVSINVQTLPNSPRCVAMGHMVY